MSINISCKVPNCPNSTYNPDPALVYYLFPIGDNDLIKKWKEVCSLPDNFDISSARVCSMHFSENSFYQNSLLKSQAFPTLNLPQIVSKSIRKADKNRKKINSKTIFKNKKITKTSSWKKNNENNKTAHSSTLKKYDKEHYKLLIEIMENNIALKTKELETLNTKVKELKRVKKNLPTKAEVILEKVFSKTQVEMILHNKKQARWNDDEIIVGYTLLQLGNLEFYKFLIREYNIPLPDRASIRNWFKRKIKYKNNSTS